MNKKMKLRKMFLIVLLCSIPLCACGEKKNDLQPRPTTIYACRDYAMRICEDGTLAAECRLENGFQEEELEGWDEIKQVAVCNEYCVAVRKDGTILMTGAEETGEQ